MTRPVTHDEALRMIEQRKGERRCKHPVSHDEARAMIDRRIAERRTAERDTLSESTDRKDH